VQGKGISWIQAAESGCAQPLSKEQASESICQNFTYWVTFLFSIVFCCYENWKQSRLSSVTGLFVCLFVGIKPEKIYSSSIFSIHPPSSWPGFESSLALRCSRFRCLGNATWLLIGWRARLWVLVGFQILAFAAPPVPLAERREGSLVGCIALQIMSVGSRIRYVPMTK